uniref:Replication factor A protein 3 n=1 Tax=Alexandrium monilatum TaxID=311494 RepID=A0A7S4W5G1_9DINO
MAQAQRRPDPALLRLPRAARSRARCSAMAAAGVAAVGMERAASMPVGERVNFQFFQQATQGASVRVGGRIAPAADDPQRRVLCTTDGGSLTLAAECDLPQTGGFVEVIGTKAGDAVLAAAGVVPLPGGEVDVELWDEAVKMAHMPQLRHLFAPDTAL